MRRHVLPQTYGIVLTQMTLLIPQYVLAEVTLTFLGLGVSEPMPSWGSLLSSLQQYYVLLLLLVDVLARPAPNPCVSRLLRGSRCTPGTLEIRLAVKT